MKRLFLGLRPTAMASPFPTSFWGSDAVKHVLLAAALASASLTAHAQASDVVEKANAAAIQGTRIFTVMAAQIEADQAKIADLQKKLDAATKPVEPDKSK